MHDQHDQCGVPTTSGLSTALDGDRHPPAISRRDLLALLAAAGVGGVAAALYGVDESAHRADAASPVLFGLSTKDLGWDAERGEYVLPPLRYAYDAIEPAIDAETMRLHHSIHHAGYVRGLNAAIASLAAIRAGDASVERVRALSRDLAFHGSGHVLHVLFWLTLRPTTQESGREPSEAVRARINADFGSIEAFKEAFVAAALAAEGSGWAVLAHEPIADRLVVMSAEKHQDLTIHGVRPLLPCDVWEHAYYLRYQNRREEYARAFLGAVDWRRVERLMSSA